MTNLEWLKTLSAEELADWFYDEWLHHLQYRWSSSRGGLIIWLKDRKTENSSEIPNNCEEQKWTKENCKGCKYNEYPYDSSTCFVRVCINGNKYEPKTEPLNQDLAKNEPTLVKDLVKDEPQTERSSE